MSNLQCPSFRKVIFHHRSSIFDSLKSFLFIKTKHMKTQMSLHSLSYQDNQHSWLEWFLFKIFLFNQNLLIWNCKNLLYLKISLSISLKYHEIFEETSLVFDSRNQTLNNQYPVINNFLEINKIFKIRCLLNFRCSVPSLSWLN